MIVNSLSSFANDLVEADLTGMMNLISQRDPDWEGITTKFAFISPKVFNVSCWNQDVSKCNHWRLYGGKGRALVYELQFTELMIHCRTDIKWLGLGQQLGQISDAIKMANSLIRAHVNEWKHYRMLPIHLVSGIYREAGPGYTIRQGWDKLLHAGKDREVKTSFNDEFTGSLCARSPRTKEHAGSRSRRAVYPPGSSFVYQEFGRRRFPAHEIQRRLHLCKMQWQQQLRDQLEKFERQALAITWYVDNLEAE